MCIINLPAEVTQTKILVAPNADKTRQITVYCNKVATQENNVMILPVPYPSSVEFIDLSDYNYLFSDLEKNFAKPIARSYGLTTNSLSFDSESIKVVDVGSYQCSLVKKFPDLDRLNSQVFGKIEDHIKFILKKYYLSFGFVVCRLKSGNRYAYHPIAYSHKMLNNNKLFVPTRHQHNQDSHSTSWVSSLSNYYPFPNVFSTNSHNQIHDEEFEADWDHEIYSFNTNKKAGNQTVTDTHLYFKKEKIPNFDFGKIHCLNRLDIHGNYDNRDVILGTG